MTEKGAGVKEKEIALGRAKRGELAARGAQAALNDMMDAAMKAKALAVEAKVNADAAAGVVTKFLRTKEEVKNVALAVKNLQQPSDTQEPKVLGDAKKAKESITEVLRSANVIMVKAASQLQDGVIAETKAAEALQHIGWAETNCTDADEYVKDAVGAAKATVTAAKTAVDRCLIEVRRAHNAAVRLHVAAAGVERAAQEVVALMGDAKEELLPRKNEILNGVKTETTKATDDATSQSLAFSDVTNNVVAAVKSVDDALTSTKAEQQPTASVVLKSMSATSAAENALREAEKELGELQVKVRQPDQTESGGEKMEEKELKKVRGNEGLNYPQKPEENAANSKGDAHEHSSLTEEAKPPPVTEEKPTAQYSKTETITAPSSVPATMPEPNSNISAAVNELLSSNADGNSKRAWVRRPLMLLLLVCMAMW
ncbi:hypothetical protein DQ04_07761040 [Trypanosoma grayi]|uniref:hypothetical protein n=1 Tax=Trypanosoma grayi TaxID=71804 RepID=UPI0004F4961F|nr:hypothetical protein DQ04_07761040 [Trypanosoma grayi]KEG08200.1 hypothetical protein DQ04_07761040 [Trypanosoma grayi]